MVEYRIPIKLPSLLNMRASWRAISKLKKAQRLATRIALNGLVVPPMPCVVTITRIGPRRLDDDNLAGACKYVRDQIATMIGVDDGSPLYTWRYEQVIGRYGVVVTIR